MALYTQSIKATKAKIAQVTGKAPKNLPEIFGVDGQLFLVRSSKNNCYYTTTTDECSCIGFHYRHACRHVSQVRALGVA